MGSGRAPVGIRQGSGRDPVSSGRAPVGIRQGSGGIQCPPARGAASSLAQQPPNGIGSPRSRAALACRRQHYLLWRYLLWRYLLWRYLLWRYPSVSPQSPNPRCTRSPRTCHIRNERQGYCTLKRRERTLQLTVTHTCTQPPPPLTTHRTASWASALHTTTTHRSGVTTYYSPHGQPGRWRSTLHHKLTTHHTAGWAGGAPCLHQPIKRQTHRGAQPATAAAQPAK